MRFIFNINLIAVKNIYSQTTVKLMWLERWVSQKNYGMVIIVQAPVDKL